MIGKIRIENHAFEEIVRSAYETFGTECSGSLFGCALWTKKGLLWMVESAHAIQLADRRRSTVIPQVGSYRGNWSVLDRNIGGFHSHTSLGERSGRHLGGKINFGKADEKVFLREENIIEVIVALGRAYRRVRLPQRRYSVSGYVQFGEKVYRADVGGYYHNGRLRRALIEVPERVLKAMS